MTDSLIENTGSDMKTKGHIRTFQDDICKPISTRLHSVTCALHEK